MISITLNGVQKKIENGLSIYDIIKDAKLDPKLIIAELNRDIVENEQLKKIKLAGGDSLELIRFVGGG